MRLDVLGERWAAFSARWFARRDFIVRSHDRVYQWQVRPWQQKLAFALGGLFLLWFVAANLGLWLQSYRLAARDQEIREGESAYRELMAEVQGYHGQWSRIGDGLRSEQQMVLDLLARDLGVGEKLTVFDTRRESARDLEGQIVLARTDLSRQLDSFEADLLQAVEGNGALRDRVDKLRAELAKTREKHSLASRAGLELESRLEEARAQLAAERAAVRRLRGAVDALESQSAQAEQRERKYQETEARLRAAMMIKEDEIGQRAGETRVLAALLGQREDDLTQSHRRVVALAKQRDQATIQLSARREDQAAGARVIAGLEARLSEERQAREAALEEVAELRDNLALAKAELVERDEALEVALLREKGLILSAATSAMQLDVKRGETAERDEALAQLEAQAQSLRSRVERMGEGHQVLMARYRELAGDTIESFEKTITMAGLDVRDLLAVSDQTHLPQGGPFVAEHDDLAGYPGGQTNLEVSMSLLDLQLDRWSLLRDLLGALPLAVPLEEYDITSSYGHRRDPLNGKKARHEGVDLAAPSRSSVYSTAPGRVISAGWKGHYGRFIEIDHGHGIRTRFAHLRGILVKRGDLVGNRDKIGLVGSSGRSSGAHLHYEVLFNGEPIDPQKFFLAGKNVFKE